MRFTGVRIVKPAPRIHRCHPIRTIDCSVSKSKSAKRQPRYRDLTMLSMIIPPVPPAAARLAVAGFPAFRHLTLLSAVVGL